MDARIWQIALAVVVAVLLLGLFFYSMHNSSRHARHNRKICQCGDVHYHSVEDGDHHNYDDPDAK